MIRSTDRYLAHFGAVLLLGDEIDNQGKIGYNMLRGGEGSMATLTGPSGKLAACRRKTTDKLFSLLDRPGLGIGRASSLAVEGRDL